MPDSLATSLLTLLSDGLPHKAADLESKLRETLPLNETIRTEFVLSELADDESVLEGEWCIYTMTLKGMGLLAKLRAKADKPIIVRKKQAGLFA